MREQIACISFLEPKSSFGADNAGGWFSYLNKANEWDGGAGGLLCEWETIIEKLEEEELKVIRANAHFKCSTSIRPERDLLNLEDL